MQTAKKQAKPCQNDVGLHNKIKIMYFDSDSTCMCGNPKVWKSSCVIKPMELETYMRGDPVNHNDNI